MKKITIPIMMIAACVLISGFCKNALSQKASIELSFTALFNSEPVVLDSIYIENLTRGGNITVYAPESSLFIENVGIADQMAEQTGFTLSQNYPNPIRKQTIIDLFLPEKDHVVISIRNIMGQEVAFIERTLSRGSHKFTCFPGQEDMYILTALSGSGSRSIKMIHSGSNGGATCKIVYSGFNDVQVATKSKQAIQSGFVFSFGDELLYLGYASVLSQITISDILEDAPLADEAYQFEMSEGIPCRVQPYFTYEGQQYRTVQIGDQCWMKENLNIGIKIEGQYEQSENGLIEKYCYNDKDNLCAYFGGLYQWNELMDYSISDGAQGICPNGWYIPTDDDFGALANYLGGTGLAGGKMKEYGSGSWVSPNTGATNESGFTGLPAGHRNAAGEFWNQNYTGNFWTSTQIIGSGSSRWYLDTSTDDIIREIYDKSYAYSIRCIKSPPHFWSCGDTIHDSRDDKIYQSVTIGNQCWMKENLNAGLKIGSQLDQLDNGVIEKYCYDNEENNCSAYGGLYQWGEMMNYTTTNDLSGICPPHGGWHLPTDEDLKILEGKVDSQYPVGDPIWDNFGARGYDAGFHLKTASGWYQGGHGSDLYGFSGLPGGYRQYSDQSFLFLGSDGYLWTTTETDPDIAIYRELYYDDDGVSRHSTNKAQGYSVRCLKEIPEWNCGDTIHDSRDDRVYQTVEMGAKCWMAENLNVGAMINGNATMTNNGVIEKYCYNNEDENCDLLGAYYSWNEMMDYSITQGTQGICPEGWHVPTDIEWCMATMYVDPTVNCQLIAEYTGVDAGLKMKTTSGWLDGGNGTNASGFSAYPSGAQDSGSFLGWGTLAYIWSSTETVDNSAFFRSFFKSEDGVMRAQMDKSVGFSTRCVKD